MRPSPRLLPLALLLAASPAWSDAAWAQTPTPVTVTGTIDSISATTLLLKAPPGGTAQTFTLLPTTLVLQTKPATLADIRPHDFVASAAIRGVDGKLHSTELRIFPEALRGVGEGQRAMGDPRGQTMTNATVTGTAITDGANRLKVSFAGGESELVLEPDVPITRIDTVDASLLKPGAAVRVQGTTGPQGATATRVTLQ